MHQTAKNHEKTFERTPVSQARNLLTAEELTPKQATERCTFGKRGTWGQLEAALASKNTDELHDALAEFEILLPSPDQPLSPADAETAAVLACSDLYVARIHNEQLPAETLATTAAKISYLADDLRQHQVSDGDKYDSYAFELDVLAELMGSGHMAFMASPGEEADSTATHYNHDVYILPPNGKKVPISCKLGRAKTTRYGGGVRHISRADMRKKQLPLGEYMSQQIPELQR